MGIVLEMENDIGATGRFVGLFDGVLALAIRDPADAIGGSAGRAGLHGHRVGDHERGIEADAELADQPRRVRVVLGLHRIHKRLGARLRHRAEQVDHLLAAHADAVVRNGQRLRLGVRRDFDFPIFIAFERLIVVERIELHLVDGIRGVRDQLAQENLAVRIERMGNQVQQLLQFGLEFQRFSGHRCGTSGGVGAKCCCKKVNPFRQKT